MKALLIGNSDGIGLATTKALLENGWSIIGISRSQSAIDSERYRHIAADVLSEDFQTALDSLTSEEDDLDLCIHCVGIGEMITLSDLQDELRTMRVNLDSLVQTAAAIIPKMVARKAGHFIGLSSQADAILSPQAPAYSASKAGYSSYLESLAMAVRKEGVFVTNVRFGFVDTKMAKGDVRPMMMPVQKAVAILLRAIKKRPMRVTAPKALVPLIKLRKWMLRLCLFFSKACK
jgi:short-subunit dehydrogenase